MEETDEKRLRFRRSSIIPPPTIAEEPSSDSTIAALVSSTPIVEPAIPIPPNNIIPRPRRRSSLSVIQALIGYNGLLPTPDARKRNFLVGSGRQIPDSAANDMASCFNNGRALTIMVATWNTGEAAQLYEQNFTPTVGQTAEQKERMLNDMSDILLPTCIDYVSDLIIVCTQEMYIMKNRMDWEILLQEVIGPTHVLYHSAHYGTLSLCVFLRRDLIWFSTEPEQDFIKFRAVNPVRTKGSVAITFNLFGTSFMLINSHFEAGDGAEGRSNRQLNFQHTITKLSIPQDYLERIGSTSRSGPDASTEESLKRNESSASLDSTPIKGIDTTNSCDLVIWAGDMNFRVDMSHDAVVEHCKKMDYTPVLAKDEFYNLRTRNGEVFSNFKEADINFPPTYKFDLRTEKDYAKQRTPSYTDRILYRDKPSSLLECTKYEWVEGVKHSDHKPVIAHFRVKLKPGSNTGHLSYGKFNHEVYKRGCEQREWHHSRGIGVKNRSRLRENNSRSSVCVLQ